MSPGGHPPKLYLAHLLPKNPAGELWRELPPTSLGRPTVPFDELIRALEDEYARAAGRARRGVARGRAAPACGGRRR